MHELGIVIKVVKNVEEFAQKNGVTKIETLVLQIGALSSVIPEYVKKCYPMAVRDTLLENTELKIETLPANAICKNCDKVFNAIKYRSTCPDCNIDDIEMLSGNEFMIKEIIAC